MVPSTYYYYIAFLPCEVISSQHEGRLENYKRLPQSSKCRNTAHRIAKYLCGRLSEY